MRCGWKENSLAHGLKLSVESLIMDNTLLMYDTRTTEQGKANQVVTLLTCIQEVSG
jgi:hypothetical protein